MGGSSFLKKEEKNSFQMSFGETSFTWDTLLEEVRLPEIQLGGGELKMSIR